MAGSRCDHPGFEQGREIAERFLPLFPWRPRRRARARRGRARSKPERGRQAELRCSCMIGAKFLNDRLKRTEPHAPMGGIENGGWKLTFSATKSDIFRDFEEERKGYDFSYSIGLIVKDDGVIQDVAYNGPAHKAGISPNDKVVAVNNRRFTASVLQDAVKKTATSTDPIELLVRNGEYFSVHRIVYSGGERYPHLERDSSKPDVLSTIIAPLVKK